MQKDRARESRGEETLQESEEKYRNLIELAPDGIMVCDLLGKVLSVNTAFTAITGFSKDALVGKHFTKMPTLIRGSLPKYIKMFAAFVKGEAMTESVFPYSHRDGSLRWAEAHASAVKVKGKPKYLQAILHDITERVRTEEALREKDYIINSASSAIATADLEGKMTYGNPAFLKKWGFNRVEEFLGKPFVTYWMVEGRLDEVMDALRGGGIWSDEIKAKRKDGSLFDVHVSAAMVRDREGNPVALTSTSIDITDRKKAEAQRERLVGELQDALAQVRNLSGLIPICANCKRIRDDEGYWRQVEVFVREHSDAEFSHSICPDCMKKLYPDFQ